LVNLDFSISSFFLANLEGGHFTPLLKEVIKVKKARTSRRGGGGGGEGVGKWVFAAKGKDHG
jgi:hypothetical protein